jgi:DNA-binding transcriptional MerR regulator
MTIGDFSQATRLSAKALRFHHREGLLAPAAIDPDNGYRLYTPDQIADAQVIRRLGDLEVAVGTLRRLLDPPAPVPIEHRSVGGSSIRPHPCRSSTGASMRRRRS